jgi:hypothetical protein
MSDNDTTPPDDMTEVEALLRDLDVRELEFAEPPADVWAGIERSLDATAGAPVVSLAERRQRRFTGPLLAVAAAVGLIIAGAVVIATRPDGSAQVVAAAQLQYDPASFDPLGEQASASVSLVEDDDGLAITIDEANLPTDLTEAADLEIWLIEPDANGDVVDLVSLGKIDGDTFAVPDGYDPDSYSVVDISVEPRDGDDAHSGRSILRGALSA